MQKSYSFSPRETRRQNIFFSCCTSFSSFPTFTFFFSASENCEKPQHCRKRSPSVLLARTRQQNWPPSGLNAASEEARLPTTDGGRTDELSSRSRRIEKPSFSLQPRSHVLCSVATSFTELLRAKQFLFVSLSLLWPFFGLWSCPIVQQSRAGKEGVASEGAKKLFPNFQRIAPLSSFTCGPWPISADFLPSFVVSRRCPGRIYRSTHSG